MRWKGRQQSDNVEDLRGQTGKGGLIVGGGIFSLLIAVVAIIFGFDPLPFLQQAGPAQSVPAQPDTQRDAAEEPLNEYSRVVLKDTEDVWNEIFASQLNMDYQEPTLRLFRDSISGACGSATSAVGPFYCPLDEKVYLDLAFFQQLQNQFGAKGDFPMAYVIAHEVAHHIQQELGISENIQRLQQQSSKTISNQLSVRLELQADYLAGVWIHHIRKSKNILEKGDIDEALYAATRIGDDVLQKQATGRVTPDGFTHGTAEQRLRWLKMGIEKGSVADQDLMAVFDLDYQSL